jgi:6-phosphogluconolactonase
VRITATSGSISGSATLIAVVSTAGTIPRFAYAANNADSTISVYTTNPATGQLRANGYALAGKLPQGLVVDPRGKFVYATSSGDNTILAFSVSADSGLLTPVTGSPFSAGSNPISLTVDPSGTFAYSVNSASNNISAFSIDSAAGSLTPITGSPFSAGQNPSSIVVDPTGRFAYVTNTGSNNVSGYAIDPMSGALTAMAGSPFVTGSAPTPVTLDPSGHFAYVANSASADISAFTIDSNTGALTALAGSPFKTGAGMQISGIAVDPSTKFLYVANFGSNNVSAFTIDASGTPTPVSGSPFPVGSGPRSVQVDATGKFVYVTELSSNEVEVFSVTPTGALSLAGKVHTRSQPTAFAMSVGTRAVTYIPQFAYTVNDGNNTASAFAIDPATGALTEVAGSPFTTGLYPIGVSADPTGKFLYVTDNTGGPGCGGTVVGCGVNNISAFSISPMTGGLTAIPGSPFSAGIGPAGLAADPSGRFLYVSNYNSFTVSAYSIDPSNGALVPVPGSPFAAGREGISVAIDPTGRFLYVGNQSCAPPAVPCGLSAFSIDPVTGVLTPVVGSPFPAGSQAAAVVIDPSGRFLYVTTTQPITFEFAIDATTGALTQIGTTAITGTTTTMTIEPSGRFAYNGVMYAIDSNTGILTQVNASPITAASAVDFSGKFAYSLGIGITGYAIDATTGVLTLIPGSPFSPSTGGFSMTTTGRIQ